MINQFKNTKVLFVVAHPDDEILGCGGLIRKLTTVPGCQIKVIILGEGILSRDQKADENQKQQLAEHQKCTHNAKEVLGYHQLEIHQLPDNQFDTVPRLQINKILEASKKDFDPDFVFTHHAGDLNVDHRITFEATLTAYRPLKGETTKGIYTFETNSSTEWAFNLDSSGFRPNVYIEIEKEHFDCKLKAMSQYVYETREFPHPRSLKALEALAMRRGSEVGFELAESFQCIRQKIS